MVLLKMCYKICSIVYATQELLAEMHTLCFYMLGMLRKSNYDVKYVPCKELFAWDDCTIERQNLFKLIHYFAYLSFCAKYYCVYWEKVTNKYLCNYIIIIETLLALELFYFPAAFSGIQYETLHGFLRKSYILRIKQ